jgi:hypothetical protein
VVTDLEMLLERNTGPRDERVRMVGAG